MLARLQRGDGHLAVKTVRRGDMHHVHVRRLQHRLIVSERLRDAMLGGHRLHDARHVAERHHLHAQPAKGFDVYGADEAGADHAGPELIDLFGWIHSCIASMWGNRSKVSPGLADAVRH